MCLVDSLSVSTEQIRGIIMKHKLSKYDSIALADAIKFHRRGGSRIVASLRVGEVPDE